MIEGLTFDTGVLIALERRNHRAREILENAVRRALRITVPSPVVVEWWRGRTDMREAILRAVRVEQLSDALAKISGEALAAVSGATAVDAVVMASAAQRGDIVYTSDVGDLTRLARHFPSVRVLGIG